MNWGEGGVRGGESSVTAGERGSLPGEASGGLLGRRVRLGEGDAGLRRGDVEVRGDEAHGRGYEVQA
jgi:hypothetical protein